MGYAVNKSVIRLNRAQVVSPLPPLLAETLPLLPDLKEAHSFAVVCKGPPACRRLPTQTNCSPCLKLHPQVEPRVPHISLVFREIWDTTDVDRSVLQMTRELEGRCSGIPHLAKNERDVGHPGSSFGEGYSPVKGFVSLGLAVVGSAALGASASRSAVVVCPEPLSTR